MSNIEQHVKSVAESLVDEAWQKYPAVGICRSFLKDKVATIQKFPPIDFVVGLATHLNRRDVQAILLSAPELWSTFGMVEWTDIMKRLSPRPRRTFADWSGLYSDVEFMCLYLRINPMAIACSPESGLDASDQARICEFCRDQADVLFLGESDYDDLNGEVLCSLRELDAARDRLIAEKGSVAPPYKDADSLRQYAITLLMSIA